MATLAKNVNLTKKRREPETTARRVPELDKVCPRCKRERGIEEPMFHYECTDSTGKSFTVDWCPWYQIEINDSRKS